MQMLAKLKPHGEQYGQYECNGQHNWQSRKWKHTQARVLGKTGFQNPFVCWPPSPLVASTVTLDRKQIKYRLVRVSCGLARISHAEELKTRQAREPEARSA